MAVMTDEPAGARAAERAGAVMRLAGAAVSLGLVVGVGVWGYKLFVRDVTGIPVVRAMEGPMRESPANPGGQIAPNMGLAVNAVAAMGEAAPPEDMVMLAPVRADLAPEDMDVQSLAEAGEVMAGDPGAPPAAVAGAAPVAQDVLAPAVPAVLSETPMTAAEVLALADMIAAGAEPLTPLAPAPEMAAAGLAAAEPAVVEPLAEDGGVEAVLASVAAAAPAPEIVVIPADVPGVRVAWRPIARPASLAVPETAAPGQASAASAAMVTPPDAIPAGTAMVQLGAYETPEIAAADWVALGQRFAEFMGDKARVIQPAESGGETFYRLRATGFADVDDANRFCAVLIAEGARCTPVLVE